MPAVTVTPRIVGIKLSQTVKPVMPGRVTTSFAVLSSCSALGPRCGENPNLRLAMMAMLIPMSIQLLKFVTIPVRALRLAAGMGKSSLMRVRPATTVMPTKMFTRAKKSFVIPHAKVMHRLGDNEVTDGEECDTGDNNNDVYGIGETCNRTCTDFSPYCGDGVQNGNEVCDDGDANADTYSIFRIAMQLF